MQKRFIGIITAAILATALCLAGSQAWAKGNSPETVVKEFATAYFMLDEKMGDYLSRSALGGEEQVDTVALYLEMRTREAQSRGYDLSYLQMKPILMKTKVLEQDDAGALVAFEADALRSVNPLFRIVGWIFGLLEEHTYSDTIRLVREDGAWKVGPGAFDLPM